MKGISSFARQRWRCPSSHSCISSLSAKPETQETILRLPSPLPTTPIQHLWGLLSFAALTILFRESLQRPPGQASPLISLQEETAVWDLDHSPPPCLKAWGPSCYRYASCSRDLEAKLAFSALPFPLCSPHPSSLSQEPKSGPPLQHLQSFLFPISDPTSLLRWALPPSLGISLVILIQPVQCVIIHLFTCELVRCLLPV